ncbi:MAG: hypothetical protein HGA87_01435 [Desulfobulbaceae bacterium]|nr:hypothetical protein [Desulfobulbaceae bacterium]
MTNEAKAYAERVMRNTANRETSEVWPVKIGELRMLCEALLDEKPDRPQLTDKQENVLTNIRNNPRRTAGELAKAQAYGSHLPMMNIMKQLADKGYIKPVETAKDVPELV